MIAWGTILDIAIIGLLLVDIVLYSMLRKSASDLSIVVGYIYNYLRQKDDKF